MEKKIKFKTESKVQSGFTLLEVLIVVVIIGIISAWATVTVIEKMKRDRAQAAAWDVISLVRDISSEAKVQKVVRAVSISNDTLKVYNDSVCTGTSVKTVSISQYKIKYASTSGDWGSCLVFKNSNGFPIQAGFWQFRPNSTSTNDPFSAVRVVRPDGVYYLELWVYQGGTLSATSSWVRKK